MLYRLYSFPPGRDKVFPRGAGEVAPKSLGDTEPGIGRLFHMALSADNASAQMNKLLQGEWKSKGKKRQ